MTARAAYYSQHSAYRSSLRSYAIAKAWAPMLPACLADSERRAAVRNIVSPPPGYGRRIVDALIIRRALRSEWMAVKSAHLVGEASELQVYQARADLTGESPTDLLLLSMKRAQCAAHGTPRDIAKRYFADVRYHTARPEKLPRRYSSRELTETERFERANPSDRRQRELRAAARAPLPLPFDLRPVRLEWSIAA